jgi:hypothetical protein
MMGEAFHQALDEQKSHETRRGERVTLGLDSGSQKVLRTSRSGEVVRWTATGADGAKVLRWWH